MPYDPSTDQYYWLQAGETQLPERDGTGFNPNAASPKFSDAYRVLSRHITSDKTLIDVVIVGKLYTGRSLISGVAGKTTLKSIRQIATIGGMNPTKRTKATPHGGGFVSAEAKAQKLLGLNQVPEKICGIYFRILD